MKIPEGYRLLKRGEVIRAGDIYCRGDLASWHPTNHTGGRWNPDDYWVMARKESEADSVSDATKSANASRASSENTSCSPFSGLPKAGEE